MFNPKKLIVEATLLPLEDITKEVEAHYGTAETLDKLKSIPDCDDPHVDFTLNIYPIDNMIRLHWHMMWQSSTEDMSWGPKKFNGQRTLKNVLAILNPWVSRLGCNKAEPDVCLITRHSTVKFHPAVLLSVACNSTPDKYSPEDKDAIHRIQYVLYKLCTEYPYEVFFEDMVDLQTVEADPNIENLPTKGSKSSTLLPIEKSSTSKPRSK